MKVAMADAASTGPLLVRPRAEALLDPISFLRMMEVSASEPQAGDAQSRGVPSVTDKPGMTTLLAPWIEVMTPWAETEAARAAKT